MYKKMRVVINTNTVSATICFILNDSLTNRDSFSKKMILTEISNKEIVKSTQLLKSIRFR